MPLSGRSARSGDRRARGAVTAETAMVLPMLVAVALALAWMVALAATQVRVVDAAREVARAAARDETQADAVALGRRVAPRGSVVVVEGRGETVVAHVTARVRGPRGLLRFLPPVLVKAEAVAAKEQQ
jgi:hypothetical protein